MKVSKVLSVMGFLLLITVVNFIAVAQEEISDEELAKYVSVMAQIDTLKAEMKSSTNDLVKNNELMDKGRVFNAIKEADGDTTALATLGISKEELAAYTEITTEIDAKTTEFKANYTSLIKDDLGASLYNRIKKGLKDDEVLKSRYDAAVLSYTKALGIEEEQG